MPTIEDKLLFILIYLKQGATQEMHATLFGMHQPDANVWIHLLHPILNQALTARGELPVRQAEAFNFEKEEELYFFHDGTERPIPRPQDQTAQKEYCSGKKKRHTIKNILVTNPQGRILFLTRTCAGKKHDKKIAEEAGYDFPNGSTLFQDAGFQGFTVDGITVIQPKKKPRGQGLALQDKKNNRAISQTRIRVEHAIGGVKR